MIRPLSLGILVLACGRAITSVAAAPHPESGRISPPNASNGASSQSAVVADNLALSEDAIVRLSLLHNPTLDIARRERNVSLIDADRNRPALRPEVTASASQILRTPRVDLPGRPDDVVLPNSISRLEVGVRQPILQFGVGSAPSQRANAMAAAARSEYQRAELDTILEAREAYLAVLRAQAMAGVAERGLELARENARLTRLLLDSGFQAEVDVLNAEQGVAEAEAGQGQARNGIALSKANLNRVLGRPVESEISVAESADLPAEPGSTAELLARALAQRPELSVLRHNMEAAEAGIRLAKSLRLPRVSLEAVYALQTETALVPKSGFAAGVSITAPLFSGAANRYTVREAEERLEQLKSAVAAREQGVALEVERQRLAMSEARNRREAAERAVAAAEKAFEITRLRMERGRALQVEVLNARLALQRALSDVATAEYDIRLAKARLDRATGELPSEQNTKTSDE